jgi:hypothetical protein
MNTATKVSAYGFAVAIVFGGAWAAGAAAGPLGETTSPSGAGHPMGHEASPAPAGERLPGLASADNGYRLELSHNAFTAGEFRFRIVGPGESAATKFEVEHDKRLHFVVVRRDGSGYQHLHPQMTDDGTWITPLTLPAAGSYRVFADFTPLGGAKTTLGADIQVPGQYLPEQYDTSRKSTVDGYEVTLDGQLTPGQSAAVTATVTRDGLPVTDLQPYLAAYGHLVALRATDLGYLHVHPLGTPDNGSTAGPQVRFAVEVPTTGRYRLFLDFQHEGKVRTAEFTVDGSPDTGHGG